MSAARAALALAVLMLAPTLVPAPAAAEHGPPLVPDESVPGQVREPVWSAYRTVTNLFRETVGITPVLFHEGFEGEATLEERGWEEEVLSTGRNAVPTWGVAAVNETRRAQGERTAFVAAGEQAASVAGEDGQYVPGRESRLVSPVLDLRYVLGASGPTGGPYDQPTLRGLVDEATELAERRVSSPAVADLGPLFASPRKSPSEQGLLEGREGAGLVNLTFWHVWDLAADDYAWLDVRVRQPDGSWSEWTPLEGDLVFETEVDYGTLYQSSAFCEVERQRRGAVSQQFFAPLKEATQYCHTKQRPDLATILINFYATAQALDPCVLVTCLVTGIGGSFVGGFGSFLEKEGRVGPDSLSNFAPMSLSQVLEVVLDGQPPNAPPAYYNDQVDHGADREPTRAWSGASKDFNGAFVIRKAHFTLNRFIGEEIQVGFHFKAGAAAQGEFGWYVDEVEVTASVPDHDPAVNAVLAPGEDDVLATDTRVRPVALVANNGRLPVRDVNVTFVVADASSGRKYLEDRVPVPYLAGVQRLAVGSSKLSEPLPHGSYVLRVNVTAPPVGGTAPQPDANPRNNGLVTQFAIRKVLDLKVDVEVPAESAMTDLDEEKTLLVRVTNLGNVNTTGTLNVTVHRVNATNGDVGPALAVLTSETLLPFEFPYGRGLTVTGAEDNFATRTVKWTGEAPGIYEVRAVFQEAGGRIFEALPRHVFVRMTPTSLLGPFDFAYNDLSPPVTDLDPNRPEQIGFDTWGFLGEMNNADARKAFNYCGEFRSSVENGQERLYYAPLCDITLSTGGLGTAKGQWTWIGTHDDYFLRVDNFHGTNILDEGILERVERFTPATVTSGQRLYVSFRHLGDFHWLQDENLNYAEPNSTRGQFRVLLNGTRPDVMLPRYDIAGRPVDPDDKLVFVRNFTEDTRWDRVLLDVTSILEHVPADGHADFKFQWVIQSTPANVLPDWRIGSNSRSEGGQSRTSECGEGAARTAGTCTLLEPVRRWAVDEIHIVAAAPSTDPLAGHRKTIFRNSAEGLEAAKAFTNCHANLRSGDSGVQKEGQHQSEPDTDPKCRQWELYKSRVYPNLWYLERAEGIGPPSAGVDDTYWLRWGNHMGQNTKQHNDPAYVQGIYSVLETPSFSLAGAQQPALSFDHWHDFVRVTYDRIHPRYPSAVTAYANEGANVWISGRDADGDLVVHELLQPLPGSASKYTLPVWSEAWSTSGRPGLRGVPEWPANYSKVVREPVAFAQTSGGGPEAEWTSAKFDLSRYARPEFSDLTWNVEFHAFMTSPGNLTSPSSEGWRIDNVQIRETLLANDVAVASIESPAPLVGPGIEQPVVVRVRNDGLFAQKGVAVEAVIKQDGIVVWESSARIPYGGEADALPGLLDTDRPDKNVTFPFPDAWVPDAPGTYRLEARVNLSGAVEPYPDENFANDVLTRDILVEERHDVSIAGPGVMPDEEVVAPAIGPVGEPRSLAFVVRNNGTVPERFLGQLEDLFRLEVDVVGEDGESALAAPLKQNLREILPGQEVRVEFPNAWLPTRSGVYRVVAEVTYPATDDDDNPATPPKPADDVSDNRRVVKHLVFDVVLPAPGANLSTEFQPDDLSLWGHNASRYAGSDGWSFPPEGEYAPDLDSALTLDRVLNLRSVRNAFLRVNQSFDFEEAYDGARVEASLDGGRTWLPVPPRLTGGWSRLSTASPLVDDPEQEAHAFTGAGQGAWEFNLGALPELRTTATLLEDDFEQRGFPQLRLNLTDGLPQAPDAPTPQGFRAAYTPIVEGRAFNEIAVEVKSLESDGRWSNISKVFAVVNGVTVELVREGAPGKVREGVYSRILPTDLSRAADRSLYEATKAMLANRSIVQFRAQGFQFNGEGVEQSAGEGAPPNPLLYHSSPIYEISPGQSFRELPAARERRFQVAPPDGQPILWSGKHAILCSDTDTKTVDRTGKPSRPTVFGNPGCVDGKPEGSTTTRKYLSTTIDLTAAEEVGFLKLEITDWAAVPKSYRKTASSNVPLESDQTIRVVFKNMATGQEVVKSPVTIGGDRYWNWTRREVVVQGEEWNRLRGSVVEVRLEHVVTATVADTPSPIATWDKHISLRSTDEYSPHFGWGIADVRIEAVGEGFGPVVKTLDPKRLSDLGDLAPPDFLAPPDAGPGFQIKGGGILKAATPLEVHEDTTLPANPLTLRLQRVGPASGPVRVSLSPVPGGDGGLTTTLEASTLPGTSSDIDVGGALSGAFLAKGSYFLTVAYSGAGAIKWVTGANFRPGIPTWTTTDGTTWVTDQPANVQLDVKFALDVPGWRQGANSTLVKSTGEVHTVVEYTNLPDVFELTREPLARGFWRPAAAWEWERPDGTNAGHEGRLNRFWEANASRWDHETTGGSARLVMPLDLKPAVGRAWLTFNHQHNFKFANFADTVGQGAAGGRVEISVDDGLTWQPLQPIRPIPEDAPVRAHPGQPELKMDNARQEYTPVFWTDSSGFGTQNPFVDDKIVSAGRAHEYGDVPRDDRGVVLPHALDERIAQDVMAFSRATTGARLVEAPAAYAGGGTHRHMDWIPVAIDLTPYAGKDVLVAFHAFFGTHTQAAGGDKPQSSWQENRDFWRIDDVAVTADVFRGDDVRLRIRAATDGTVSGGGLDVRDVQLLTQKHLQNVGARVLSPGRDDPLRAGENPVAVEIANKGVLPVTSVHVDVWVNATGPGAPPPRHWGGPLQSFTGCGQPVPPDGVMPPESVVEICGNATAGAFAVAGAPDAEYTVQVLVRHADFDREILVGDNLVTHELSGDQVLVSDQVFVERLVLRPSVFDRAAPRDVVVEATLRFKGFDRADVSDARLRILGDAANPVELGLGQAQSFVTRFTVPGETRDLVWVVPKEQVARLTEGVLTAEVAVRTASSGAGLVSVRTAPLHTARDIAPEPGFLHFEDARDASVDDVANALSATGKGDQDQFSRDQCPADPVAHRRVWCSYNKPWNETGAANPAPNPSVSMCSDSFCHWKVDEVMDTSGLASDSIPASVKAHGRVFVLEGFKNVPQCAMDGQTPVCREENRGVSLESPPIDVRGMVGEGGDKRILLSFRQRYDLGAEGAFAKVFVAPWDIGDPDRRVPQKPIEVTNGSSNRWIEVHRFAGSSDGFGDYDFEALTLDLAGAIAANNTKDLDFRHVKVRFVLYLPEDARFTLWQIDDVLVGPFGGTLGPAQAFPLSDDSDKTYKYYLRNAGAFSDTYNVTLRRADGGRVTIPDGWNVTILDEDGAILDQLGAEPHPTDKCAPVQGERRDTVELGAGDARLVRLKICIPVSSGTPGRAGFAPIQINAFSQTVPTLVSGSSMELDYSYLNRPNLRILAVRPGLDVPVDQPRQVVAEVSNTGNLAACSTTIRMLDVLTGEAPVTIYAPDGTEPSVGACRKRADGTLDGGLPPGEARQFRFIWTPRQVGTHNLTAVADPDNLLSELLETDNVKAVPVEIRLPSFPDLAVRVQVSDDEPNIGDAVNISVSITNRGGISAESVNLTLKVGVTDLLGRGPLAENLIPRIEPGETVWVNKTWRAVFPGKALLYMHVLPRDGVLERVETQGDNLVVLPLFVRSQGLDVAAKVVGVTVSPGQADEVGFVVSNNGDTPDSYTLEVQAPRGVRAGVFHEGRKVTSLSLANQSSTNLTVLLDLPARFAAGDYALGLKAVSENTSQTRVAQFTLSVRASYGLSLEGAQALTAPGRVEIPLAVTNLGNARDAILVEAANAPPGWKSVPHADVVDPYGRNTTKLVLDVPTTTPRGIYEVLARVRDHHGAEATAVVGVTIQEFEAAVPAFATEETLVRPESLVATKVRLANEGNVRAEARVEARGPPEWTVRLDRPVVVLAPGESVDVALEAVVPPEAPFGTSAIEVVSTTGTSTRVDTLTVEVGGSDLHVLELDYAPRVGVLPGTDVNFSAVVRNDGEVDADAVGVAFYVDDVLVGYETVDALPAGGEQTVSFRWSAVGGEHVLLAILDAGDEVRETDEANNARLEIVRVGAAAGILSAAEQAVPGPAALAAFAALAVAALAAAASSRQRKTR